MTDDNCVYSLEGPDQVTWKLVTKAGACVSIITGARCPNFGKELHIDLQSTSENMHGTYLSIFRNMTRYHLQKTNPPMIKKPICLRPHIYVGHFHDFIKKWRCKKISTTKTRGLSPYIAPLSCWIRFHITGELTLRHRGIIKHTCLFIIQNLFFTWISWWLRQWGRANFFPGLLIFFQSMLLVPTVFLHIGDLMQHTGLPSASVMVIPQFCINSLRPSDAYMRQ